MTTDPRERANSDARAFALELARAFLAELTSLVEARSQVAQLPPPDPATAHQPGGAIGTPMGSARDVERFWSQVKRGASGDCWPWQGTRNAQGYGVFKFDNTAMLAHRYAYMLRAGPIPPGMWILHACDNPWCSNPGHLRAGTARENARDRNSRQRHVWGERHYATHLTAEDVRAIRRSSESGIVLAQRYGVTRPTIYNIINRRSWKLVDDEPAGDARIAAISPAIEATPLVQTPAKPAQP
jgi:hypothetical protein